MEKEYLTFEQFKMIAKNILKEFKYFCEANNLKFFLASGTLLGAVRHNDFIPWDYDIDVQMPREDFDRLLELTQNSFINKYYKVFSWKNTPDYYLPFAKICDTRTRLVITQTNGKVPLGVWIDVFPTDGLPNDGEGIEKLRTRMIDMCSDAFVLNANMNTKEKIANCFKLLYVKLKSQTKILEELQSMLRENDYSTSEKTCTGDMMAFIRRHWLDRKYFEETVMLPFGDEIYPCPKEYDAVLSTLYGDYMQLPPEEERTHPDIKSYYV